jgi:hypothetical protein
MTRPDLHFFILDALANDIESLADIVRLVNHPEMGWAELAGGPISPGAVAAALPVLVEDDLIEAFAYAELTPELQALPRRRMPVEPLEQCYFGLTGHGREMHTRWQPRRSPREDSEFEHVLRVDNYYDGLREGVALFHGEPHHFRTVGWEDGEGDPREERFELVALHGKRPPIIARAVFRVSSSAPDPGCPPLRPQEVLWISEACSGGAG